MTNHSKPSVGACLTIRLQQVSALGSVPAMYNGDVASHLQLPPDVKQCEDVASMD